MLACTIGDIRSSIDPRRWLAALIAIATLLQATGALAYDRILLRAGDVGNDAPFLQRFLDEELELIRPDDEATDEMKAWSEKYFREWVNFAHVYVGRFDINDDGENELFVMLGFPSRCASAGCETYLFRRTEHGWQELSMPVDPVPVAPGQTAPRWLDPAARERAYQILASEERVGGYRTLVGDEFGGRWQPASEFAELILLDEAKYRDLPGGYLLLCFSRQCAHESDEPLVKPPKR
jgi:hypothetical protein